MKYCNKCGAELKDDAVFCKKCGASVTTEQKQSENNTNNTYNVVDTKEKAKANKGIIIGIIGGLIVISAIILYFLLIRPYPSKIAGVYVNDNGITTDVYSFSKDGSFALTTGIERGEGIYTTKDKKITLNFETSKQGPHTITYDYKIADGGIYLTDQILGIETFFRDDTNGAYGNKEKQYAKAKELFESGNYEASKEMFSSLDGYADSSAMVVAIEIESALAGIEMSETTNQEVVDEKESITGSNSATGTTEGFVGNWISEGERGGIEISNIGDHFSAYMEGSTSAYSGITETMTCYSLTDGTLSYIDGTENTYMYDNYGNEANILEFWDEKGTFRISKGVYPQGDNIKGIFSKNWSLNEKDNTYLVWEVEFSPMRASDEYVIWYSQSLVLEDKDVDWLDTNSLKIARNEIYARYGRKFTDSALQSHFDNCSWYYGTTPPESFNDNVLSQIEKDNVKLIEKYENGLSASSGTTPMWVVNCNEFITLRAEPNTKAADLAHIPLYAKVNFLNYANNGFYQVEYNGKVGYALAQYLDEFEPQL